jgi:predicted Zn finger-like uncharacterized protein
MKIVCEACQAKYSISDDKVRGKAFKIRCKKCSHIIVVRAADGGGSGPTMLPDGGSGAVPTTPASENSWHIVVDGEQVGPLAASDVRARLARGEVTAETYIWREGMADWLKISSVAEFSESGQALEDSGSPFPPQSGNADSAYRAGAEADVFAAPTQISSTMTADLFASPVSAAPEPASAPAPSSFSFGSAAPASRSEGSGLRGGNGSSSAGLTGQRHENSVLFSLSNLEALASPSSSPSPRPGVSPPSEGSGLIDIRSMAAMTLGNGPEKVAGNDLPTFGAPQFSPVAPVLLPMSSSGGPSKWVVPLLVAVLVVGGVLTVGLIKMLGRSEAPPAPSVVVAPAPAPLPTPTPAPSHSATPPTTPPPAANEALPPRDTPPATAAVAPKPPAAGHPIRGPRRNPHLAEAPMGAPTAAHPAPAARPEPPEKPATKGDKLDDLLNAALGSKGRQAPAARPRDEEEPVRKPVATLGSLNKDDMVKGMQGVSPRVHDCYNQYKQAGTAMVSINVARGGRVSAATVSGKFAGTPTGTCVEAAVKGAKFPPVEAQNFQFPFALH